MPRGVYVRKLGVHGYKKRPIVHGTLYAYQVRKCRCELCIKARRDYWHVQYGRNPEPYKKTARRGRLWTRYRLTDDDYDKMLKAQNSTCKICNRPPSLTRHLSVDHDHTTGLIRGLLCQKCNGSLGWFEQFSGEILAYLGERI